MEKRIALFVRLAAANLLLSGMAGSAIALAQSRWSLLIFSAVVLGGGIGGIWLASRSALLPDLVVRLFERFGRTAAFLPMLVLNVFLFGTRPSQSFTLLLSPFFIGLWVIGLAAVWIFDQPDKGEPIQHQGRGGWFSLPSLVFAVGFLLIPSRVPSLLDGIPLHLSFEVVTAALLFPFVWLINARFFADRRVAAAFLVLLLIKISAFLLFPQYGFGVRVYAGHAPVDWNKSYTSWLAPGLTEVMQSPYTRLREFPVEWVNERAGFDFDAFRMLLEIRGAITIEDAGRFVVVMRGASQADMRMFAAETGETATVVFVDDYAKLDAELYQRLPSFHDFDLHGKMLYTRFGEARLEPVLLYEDGSFVSLFGNAGVWLSREYAFSRSKILFYETLLNLSALVFIFILIAGLWQGLSDLYARNQISLADLYLASYSAALFYLAFLADKPQVPFFLLGILALVVVMKLLDFRISPSRPGIRAHLVFVGLVFLTVYFSLDADRLRAVAILPEAQDGLEYQTFARRIFVDGDLFLGENPPRAYKVLFPYVVGALHTFFGQSSAAQFLLNAWSAVLSAALTFSLAKRFSLPLWNAFLVSVSLLAILCLPSSYIYYFRFGLIEPVAILCLLAVFWFALEQRTGLMWFVAALTVLFRLDYLGLVLVAIVLMSDPIIGDVKTAWSQLWKWLCLHAGRIAIYFLAVILSPLLVIAGYFSLTPNYMLNASDTGQTSVYSMLEGFMRVLIGGNMEDFQHKLSQNSYGFLLIVIPLAFGFIVSMLSIFYRRSIFAKIDLRLALLVPSILPAYIVVRPAAYFPRFSFPILVLDLILIGLFLYHLLRPTTLHQDP